MHVCCGVYMFWQQHAAESDSTGLRHFPSLASKSPSKIVSGPGCLQDHTHTYMHAQADALEKTRGRSDVALRRIARAPGRATASFSQLFSFGQPCTTDLPPRDRCVKIESPPNRSVAAPLQLIENLWPYGSSSSFAWAASQSMFFTP